MNLQIRDPRARELAQKLAERKGVTITEAVVGALEAELGRHDPKQERIDKLKAIVDGLHAKAKPGGRDLTKDEIDAMWGMDE